MTVRYDSKYRISDLTEEIYLKLAKIEDADYYISKSFSLFIKKIGPYKIVKKISPLIYRLELLLSISRVYSIIFVIYLKQIKPDSFNRKIPSLTSIIFQEYEEYIVEKIIRREK